MGVAMRFGVSGRLRRNLAQGAAVMLMGGVAAGCSSDVTRFNQSILTGSGHPASAAAPVQQVYPGDYSGLDTTYTGSVGPAAARAPNVYSRNIATPVPGAEVGQGQAYPVQQQQAAYPAVAAQPALAPIGTAAPVARGPALVPVAASDLDGVTTGSVAPVQPSAPRAAAPAGITQEGGWSRAGGTQVTVRQGETVYNLSRRFGVPVQAIVQANGLGENATLAAGQQVVIPTFVYSSNAPVSAPDSNPQVADARSSTGTRYDVPAGRTPVPTPAPSNRVAVVPQQAQPRQDEAAAAPSAPAGEPARTTPPAGGATYTVVPGDTLSAISRKTGASTQALMDANGLSNGLIRVGQVLNLPSAAGTGQRAVDPVSTATTAPAAQAPERPASPAAASSGVEEASRTAAVAPGATGIGRLRWPVEGRVTAPFGATVGGRPNDGIDIAVPIGTSVRAAENGVVIYAGDGLRDFGSTVLLRHENGLVTVYGHASEIKVARGDNVRRGQEIARSGMSGSADTPRLHFEVRRDSTPVDPAGYLE